MSKPERETEVSPREFNLQFSNDDHVAALEYAKPWWGVTLEPGDLKVAFLKGIEHAREVTAPHSSDAERLRLAVEKADESRCSDGNCILRDKSKPQGQHTNGGCRCLDGLPGDKRLAVTRLIFALRAIGPLDGSSK